LIQRRGLLQTEFAAITRLVVTVVTCRYLAHVKPGDGPSDDHALDFRCALEDGEAGRRARSSRR